METVYKSTKLMKNLAHCAPSDCSAVLRGKWECATYAGLFSEVPIRTIPLEKCEIAKSLT
jgi:hypothetical protein